jgi:hypothetical protein
MNCSKIRKCAMGLVPALMLVFLAGGPFVSGSAAAESHTLVSQTVVSYIPPSRLLKDLGNPKLDKMAEMLDGKLSAMVGMLNK